MDELSNPGELPDRNNRRDEAECDADCMQLPHLTSSSRVTDEPRSRRGASSCLFVGKMLIRVIATTLRMKRPATRHIRSAPSNLGLMTCQPPRSCGGRAEAMFNSTELLNATRSTTFADGQARAPSTMQSGHLVGTTRVIFNPACTNILANSFFVRSRPPMMSI